MTRGRFGWSADAARNDTHTSTSTATGTILHQYLVQVQVPGPHRPVPEAEPDWYTGTIHKTAEGEPAQARLRPQADRQPLRRQVRPHQGAAYVAECDGQYAHALGRNIGVSLLLVETTGALGAAFMTILRILAKQTRLPGATDLTQYGEGRASTKAFLTHHVANISTVVQAADAHIVRRIAPVAGVDRLTPASIVPAASSTSSSASQSHSGTS